MKKAIIIGILFLSACSSSDDGDNDSSYYEDTSDSCSSPTIKGNLTTYNGERIYHVPGGQYYGVTDAEEMFCTEQDARDAGYRKSQR